MVDIVFGQKIKVLFGVFKRIDWLVLIKKNFCFYLNWSIKVITVASINDLILSQNNHKNSTLLVETEGISVSRMSFTLY